METIVLLARLLLGLMFAVFGLNGFFHFIALPPHEGVAGQFMHTLSLSKYFFAIYALQTLAGGLLLINRFVVLALAILAPILVNITLFHFFMEPRGAAAVTIGIALWAVLVYRKRATFAVLWSPRGVS